MRTIASLQGSRSGRPVPCSPRQGSAGTSGSTPVYPSWPVSLSSHLAFRGSPRLPLLPWWSRPCTRARTRTRTDACTHVGTPVGSSPPSGCPVSPDLTSGSSQPLEQQTRRSLGTGHPFPWPLGEPPNPPSGTQAMHPWGGILSLTGTTWSPRRPQTCTGYPGHSRGTLKAASTTMG